MSTSVEPSLIDRPEFKPSDERPNFPGNEQLTDNTGEAFRAARLADLERQLLDVERQIALLSADYGEISNPSRSDYIREQIRLTTEKIQYNLKEIDQNSRDIIPEDEIKAKAADLAEKIDFTFYEKIKSLINRRRVIDQRIHDYSAGIRRENAYYFKRNEDLQIENRQLNEYIDYSSRKLGVEGQYSTKKADLIIRRNNITNKIEELKNPK